MSMFNRKKITSNKEPLSIKGEFDEKPFDLIIESEILTKKEIDRLIPLKNELKETFIKSQVFRTRTEMEVSVLNNIKHPTPESKYWQSVREQNVMFTQLVLLSYDYREDIVNGKILQRRIDKETDNLKKELLQIKLERKMFSLKNHEKTAKDRIREIIAWSEIKEREARKMSKENLQDVDNHQLISYTKRWIKQSIQMGNNGSPSERQNLIGQLRSGMLSCIEKGLIDKVLDGFSKNVQTKIKEDYGIK